MNRRGSLEDAIVGWIWLFLIAIVIIVCAFVLLKFNEYWQASPVVAQESKDLVAEQAAAQPSTWDGVFIVLYIAVVLGLIASSYALQIEPVGFWALWILCLIAALVGAILSNAFGEVIAHPLLSATATNFPAMSYILEHYFSFILSPLGLMLIVYFLNPGGIGPRQ